MGHFFIVCKIWLHMVGILCAAQNKPQGGRGGGSGFTLTGA